jgi:uncharacterized protein
MSTKRVLIDGAEKLEGIVREGTGKGRAVICHPHPLYGGDMENNVVGAMEEGFSKAGFTTVKFNFRGIGDSTGQYGGGEGEIADVVAACHFIEEMTPDSGRAVLAGYSFGAWVSVRASTRLPFFTDLFLVALPFSMGGSDGIATFPGRTCFIGGSRDDVSPVKDLLRFYRGLRGEKCLKVIPSSHLFEGREAEISAFVLEVFRGD